MRATFRSLTLAAIGALAFTSAASAAEVHVMISGGLTAA